MRLMIPPQNQKLTSLKTVQKHCVHEVFNANQGKADTKPKARTVSDLMWLVTVHA